MPFFYPNRINDFWRIMGIAVYGDRQHLIDPATETFRLDDIRRMLKDLHIACGIPQLKCAGCAKTHPTNTLTS